MATAEKAAKEAEAEAKKVAAAEEASRAIGSCELSYQSRVMLQVRLKLPMRLAIL